MILAVAHEKGGSGKTTTALNLIPLFKPDLVIDLDPLKILNILNGLREDDKKINVVHCENEHEFILQLKNNIGKNIIIDCGGFDSEATRTAIAAADLVVTPCNGDPSELIGLMAFNNVLNEISKKIGENISGHVLINRTDPRVRDHQGMIDFVNNVENLSILKSVIPARKPVVHATKRGLAITEIKSKNKSTNMAQKEFKALTRELKDLL